MKKLIPNAHCLGLAIAALLLTALTTGCPSLPDGTVKILFSGDSLAKALLAQTGDEKAGAVDVAGIESFTVKVTKIEFDKASIGRVTVFEGDETINLIDLQGVSTLLSSANIDAGDYTKIRLSIAEPKLVLKSDPDTEITDIHLTANANMFVSTSFTVPEGQTSNILLDFGGIHLVQQGNGGYTLTPQLRADIDVQNADVTNTGTIESVDTTTSMMSVTLPDGSASVSFATAQIFLESDTDTPAGTSADLVPGALVEIQGTIDLDGVIAVTTIRLLPPAV